MFEERVARSHRAHVALQQRQVTGLRLGKQEVNESAPNASGALHQLQVLRAENHRAKCAQIVSKFFDRLLIKLQSPFSTRPRHPDVVGARAHHAAAYKVATLSMPHQLRTAHAAERAQGTHQVDCLQQVCLALCIVAQQQVEAGREISVQPAVIPEIAKPQMRQVHG